METKIYQTLILQTLNGVLQTHLLNLSKTKLYSQDELMLLINFTYNMNDAINIMINTNCNKSFELKELENILKKEIEKVNPLTVEMEFDNF